MLVTATRDGVCEPWNCPFGVHKPMGDRFPSQIWYSIFPACALLLHSSFVGVMWACGASDMYCIEIGWIVAIVKVAGDVIIRKWLCDLPWVIGVSANGCFAAVV